MLNDIGASAIRSLSVDIANLSARLAVQTATLEKMVELAGGIDPTTWREADADGESVLAIPPSHGESVRALLSVIAGVQ